MLMLPDWTSPILGWLKAFKGCSLLFSRLTPVPDTCLGFLSRITESVASSAAIYKLHSAVSCLRKDH